MIAPPHPHPRITRSKTSLSAKDSYSTHFSTFSLNKILSVTSKRLSRDSPYDDEAGGELIEAKGELGGATPTLERHNSPNGQIGKSDCDEILKSIAELKSFVSVWIISYAYFYIFKAQY